MSNANGPAPSFRRRDEHLLLLGILDVLALKLGQDEVSVLYAAKRQLIWTMLPLPNSRREIQFRERNCNTVLGWSSSHSLQKPAA